MRATSCIYVCAKCRRRAADDPGSVESGRRCRVVTRFSKARTEARTKVANLTRFDAMKSVCRSRSRVLSNGCIASEIGRLRNAASLQGRKAL